MDKLSSLVSRLFFTIAFVLLGLAVLEKALNLGGYTLSWVRTDSSRLLEFATIMLVFVTLHLREIRQKVGKGRSPATAARARGVQGADGLGSLGWRTAPVHAPFPADSVMRGLPIA